MYDPRARGPYNFDERDGTPYSSAPNADKREGEIYVHLGSVSEDILRDSRKFFEDGLPVDDPNNPNPVDPEDILVETDWGKVPIRPQIDRNFDNSTIEQQDLGLDGLANEEERTKYQEYINLFPDNIKSIIEQDPSNDDFVHFGDASLAPETPAPDKYARFRFPQGNNQRPNDGSNSANFATSATRTPDMEDIDGDFTMNESEAYFSYRIPVQHDGSGGIDMENDYVIDRVEGLNGRTWYRIKVPIDPTNGQGEVSGTVNENFSVIGQPNLRSIRFMRMVFTGFEDKTIFRFARMNLVRSQWRKYKVESVLPGINPGTEELSTTFDVTNVNYDENSQKLPFGYVIPPGIARERTLGATNLQAFEVEQSLAMNVCDLKAGQQVSIFKNSIFDLRFYEGLKMFVHAEAKPEDVDLQDKEMSVFIRVGSDFTNNYYEFEKPLTLSDEESGLTPLDEGYNRVVWNENNDIVIDFELLKQIKLERNANGAYGLKEKGGAAALARLDMQLADFGSLSLAGSYSSIGFGALNESLMERQISQMTDVNVSSSLELGRFFPKDWGVNIPFMAQYSKAVETPKYDPFDRDVTIEERLDNLTADETANKTSAPPGRDKKKNSKEVSKGLKLALRPLMMLRNVNFDYGETFGTIIPGYMPESEFFGMTEQFDAPGWGFVAGLQPNINSTDYYTDEDYLYNNWNWITENQLLNQQVQQNYGQEYSASIDIEPYNDFKIDLDVNRSYTTFHTEDFRRNNINIDLENAIQEDYEHLNARDIGSINMSYITLNTLNTDLVTLFRAFEDNRAIVSQRLNAAAGVHADTLQANQGYAAGYGRVQQAVLVPTFLATYTGQDVNLINVDQFDPTKNLVDLIPLPNWTIRYNGLTKMKPFSDLFSRFSVSHGYKSTITVNQFESDLLFNQDQPELLKESTLDYYTRFEVPDVVISESFSPLIGINVETKTGLSTKLEYKKSRNVQMNFLDGALNETRREDFTFGFGYRISDFKMPFMKDNSRKKKDDKPAASNNNRGGRGGNRGGGLNEVGDLSVSLDMSIAEDITYRLVLDQEREALQIELETLPEDFVEDCNCMSCLLKKGQMFNEVQEEVEAINSTPVADRIDLELLDSYLKEAMKNNGVKTTYNYGVYSNSKKKFVIEDGHFLVIDDAPNSSMKIGFDNLFHSKYKVSLFTLPGGRGSAGE
ncbi:unnamed protein product [Bathycoccus prasinos]